MNSEKYEELEQRASAVAELDAIKRLEARARVHQTIKEMLAEGKALTLSDEEIQLLESFRRFKVRMRKPTAMFTWQTCRPDGVQIVDDTAEIIHPSEAAR